MKTVKLSFTTIIGKDFLINPISVYFKFDCSKSNICSFINFTSLFEFISILSIRHYIE